MGVRKCTSNNGKGKREVLPTRFRYSLSLNLLLLVYTVKAGRRGLRRETASLNNGHCPCFHSELSNLAQDFPCIPSMPLKWIKSLLIVVTHCEF